MHNLACEIKLLTWLFVVQSVFVLSFGSEIYMKNQSINIINYVFF